MKKIVSIIGARLETVEDGWNVLVGADKGKILEAIKDFEPKKRNKLIFLVRAVQLEQLFFIY